MHRQNIRVYPEVADDPDTPHCPHGPCLLFSRQSDGKNKDKKFFACSACRNRKDCNFFRWLDQHVGRHRRIDADDGIRLNEKGATESVRRFSRFKELKESNSPSINFCETCEILLKKDEKKTHLGHLQKIICFDNFKPSSLLRPLQNDSKNAQYHFSEDSERFLTKTILESKFERVVCIGTPRLYESLVRQMDNTQVVLMDIDSRYEQFISPENFYYFNMLNSFFFRGGDAKEKFIDWLKNGGKTLCVIDPPFGALVDVLAYSLQTLQKWYSENDEKQLLYMLVMPYFMEKRILKSLTGASMLEYQVTYENHKKLKRSSNGVKGSPVRIFTNISPAEIRLPCQDYRFCRLCERYVKKNNIHCPKCNSCTGKDGGRYVHCESCEKCVKENREHCFQCGFCHLPNDHRRLAEEDEESRSSKEILEKKETTKTFDDGLSSPNTKRVITIVKNKRMKEDMKGKKTDCTDYSLSQFDRTIENGKRKLKEKPDKKECLKAKKKKKKHCLDYELSHSDGKHVRSIEKRRRKLKEKKQPATKRLKRKRL